MKISNINKIIDFKIYKTIRSKNEKKQDWGSASLKRKQRSTLPSCLAPETLWHLFGGDEHTVSIMLNVHINTSVTSWSVERRLAWDERAKQDISVMDLSRYKEFYLVRQWDCIAIKVCSITSKNSVISMSSSPDVI